MRLMLRDNGFSYKSIMNGRHTVGRVVKCADGRYLAIIDRIKVYHDDEAQAFHEAAAQHFGFASHAELEGKKRVQRVAQRARKAHARRIADEYLRGNPEPLLELFRLK
jgi:hypothetical protein